jgi:hypothetical protein
MAPQVADPTNHFTIQIQALSSALKVPMRIFLGSEAAHLASTQDATTWNRRLGERRESYLTPFVINAFVERLVLLGVLPTPKNNRWYVHWHDLNAVTEKDRADVAMKVTQSLLQYVTSGAEKVMPFRMYLTFVLRFADREADTIVKEANRSGRKFLTKELWNKAQAQNGQGGTDPTRRTGVSGRRNAQTGASNGRQTSRPPG